MKLNTRKTFLKCGACSHAMYHLLNHEFGNVKPIEEKASDVLAGGIAMQGLQCGMIWGGAFAVGAEAFRRYPDRNEATAVAIQTSKYVLESFHSRAGTVNCADISKADWRKKKDFIVFFLKTLAGGFVYSHCFNLMAKWTPEAIQAANKGLMEKPVYSNTCLSCASEVLKKMGATDEESVTVAGLAGGIGLSGSGCGALSAVIWYKMLDFVKNNPKKNPDMFKNPVVMDILDEFFVQTNYEMECQTICGRKFNSINEHSEYIQNGGCRVLIETLAKL